jgi:hypothetical protein
MRSRVLGALWIVVGVAVWNGFFDLYVSRGAREYGQKQAEFELGLGPQPSMAAVMSNAKHDGVVMSTIWAAGVVAAGFATIALTRTRRT